MKTLEKALTDQGFGYYEDKNVTKVKGIKQSCGCEILEIDVCFKIRGIGTLDRFVYIHNCFKHSA